MIKASLIISFYNNLFNLKLILAALEIQSEKDFEVIIADDGSKKEIVKEITQLVNQSPLVIKHVWHEDNGWWKNRILNQAVSVSESENLIFIDGDCIPHHHFINDHLSELTQHFIIGGRRCNLSEHFSNNLSEAQIKNGQLTRFFSFWKANRRMRHFEKSIRLPWKWIRPFLDKQDKGLLGCNFSVKKARILQVNGFDERYKSPGVGEDTDLEVRLHQIGMSTKTIPFKAIQYHLYHERLSRVGENENLKLLKENTQLSNGWTPFGISQDS